MKVGSALTNVALVAAMYAVCWPFLAPLTTVEDAPVSQSTWLLVILSAVCNLVVIAYHYAVPPHPKFLMVPWRKAILRVHITSGTVELFSGLTALLMTDHAVAARVMAAAALFFHVPSAFAQTPIVFGARAVMRPGYLLCIGLHAFCAAMLWQHPSSTFWVASTFLVFNVYVWCRIYYYVFDKVGLFQGARYSVSILAAGLTTTPGLLGANAIVVLVMGCGVYMLLAWLLFARGKGAWADWVRERARDSALPDQVRGLFAGSAQSDRAAADAAFDRLDQNRDGALTPDEVKALLTDAGVPLLIAERFLQTRTQAVDRELFWAQLWPIPEVRERAFLTQALSTARSERDKAELVFQRLDVDADGKLSRLELEPLLQEWSMPATDVDRWLSRSGASEKGFLAFDDFLKHLRPVWRFIYYDIVEAQHGAREDMIVRAVSAAKDASAQDRVRTTVSEELARHVPFLAQAGAALIEELASSLVEETIPPGQPLFVEGAVGDAFYLIRSGSVRLSQRGEKLADLGVGDYLGEGALLTRAPRAATALATTSVVVLSMTSNSFAYLMEKHPALKEALAKLHAERSEERRLKMLHQLMQIEQLGAVPLLKHADETLKRTLVEQLQRREVGADEIVFREGDLGDAFYLVGHGAVRVLKGTTVIAELGTGAWFGEGALLSGEPRAATVLTATPSVLYTLPRHAFESALVGSPEMRRAVEAMHGTRRSSDARRAGGMAALRRLPFLRTATTPLIEALSGELTSRTVDTGEVLMREGETGASLYLLLQGAVRVEREGLALAELTDGAFFGERAVLEATPRQATVVALEPCELLELTRTSVDLVRQTWPELSGHLTSPPPRPSRPNPAAASRPS